MLIGIFFFEIKKIKSFAIIRRGNLATIDKWEAHVQFVEKYKIRFLVIICD